MVWTEMIFDFKLNAIKLPISNDRYFLCEAEYTWLNALTDIMYSKHLFDTERTCSSAKWMLLT